MGFRRKYWTLIDYWDFVIVSGIKTLICQIFGHAKPLKKMSGDICSRCLIVLNDR